MRKYTKIISVMLAIILAAITIPFTTFAAEIGDVNADGEVTAVDARLILQVVAGIITEADLENAAGADMNSDKKITAVDARFVLQKVAGAVTPEQPEPEEPTPDTPVVSQKAEIAALFNAETAKAVKGEYKWTRECNYVTPLKAEGVDVSLIQSIVDKFLGIGTTSGTQADAGKNQMIAMNLTEADIKEFSRTNEQISLTLNDAVNPTVGGNFSLSHVSNDIITKADAENEIKANLKTAKLNSFHAEYQDIKVIAYLDKDGNPTKLSISYTLSANLEAQVAIVKAKGEGKVETKIEYTDFNY